MLQSLDTAREMKRSLLRELSSIFEGNEAYSITKIILEYLGFTEMEIVKNPDAPVNIKVQDKITKIVAELKQNKPIQYILGETTFMGLKMYVNEHVLIPRPETEEMVLKILKDNRLTSPKVMDIGCGSGCIAISLAKEIPSGIVYALDLDEDALEVAKKNAAANDVRITFIRENILNAPKISGSPAFDLIVSNPPYVTESEKAHMLPNVVKYEPGLALYVSDEDPLMYYRGIIAFADHHLADQGIIWVEINEKYGEECENLLKRSGYSMVELIQDIHKKDRFIKAMKNGRNL